jgi:hypothetical protein
MMRTVKTLSCNRKRRKTRRFVFTILLPIRIAWVTDFFFHQAGIQKKGDSKRKDDKDKSLEETNKKYFQGCQILERMVNQNIYDEISQGTVPT